MRNLEELIDVLYKEKLESISVTKNDPDLQDRFHKYMKKKYEKFAQRLMQNPKIEQQMVEDWYRTELRHWGDLPADAIYSHFTPDKALLEIDTYSGKIFTIAKKKFIGDTVTNADINNVTEYVAQMKSLLSDVLQENIIVAKKLISEGMVEADYVCGEAQNISMRLSNVSRYIPRDEQ